MNLLSLLLLIRFTNAFVPPGNIHRYFDSSLRADYGFEQIRLLDVRLEKLESSAPDILGNFYEANLKSFSIVPGTVSVSFLWK